MKIEVIIPVINYGLAMSLLHQMNENSRPPDRVIIIDNTERTHVWMLPSNFILDFYHTESRMVNESWELGRSLVSPDCDLVTFLNDDLIIGDWFFQRVIDTFKASEKFGVAVPCTVKSPNEVKEGKAEWVFWSGKKLEGWAFTIKKEILDQIPPIPYERVPIFYGDNWIWRHTKDMGYVCGKDLGNTIYHYVGQSILKLGFRAVKKREYNEWQKIKQDTWGKR